MIAIHFLKCHTSHSHKTDNIGYTNESLYKNGQGHMTKMAAMDVIAKIFKTFETWHEASEMGLYKVGLIMSLE